MVTVEELIEMLGYMPSDLRVQAENAKTYNNIQAVAISQEGTVLLLTEVFDNDDAE